ncbi:GNAT family N-acetyltransferase [Asticcacaulis sp. BYS171W]|uniref:GNAT family N-acetyltransferase n=1 Tax=Asticcacaulis aquaticus TaxID=2984212 RepID=A0ABT5HNK0_9CAUL|nr:GNAT family N-acetyltransferase [Asticcacaulis aquaticus]MDC7681646.1 GNAT family N-acetyltransferase [Asticcacaulis aquaticus]
MLIRPAEPADFTAIADIYRDGVLHGTGTFDEVPPTASALQARWQEITAMNLPYLVAVEGDNIIGFAYASPFRQRVAYRYGVEDSIYVHPDHKGAGVGKALLSALITACTEGGFYAIYAVIGDAANTGSIRLHETLGFEHTGTLPRAGYKFDRWIDVIFMMKTLRPMDGPAEGTGWAI